MIKTNYLKIVAVLTISASFALPQSTAFAAGTGDDPRPIEDVPTPEQIEASKEQSKFLNGVIDDLPSEDTEGILKAMDLGEKEILSVRGFEQETSYWCGPATVKQVLHYLNGSSDSQSDYADELGTTRDGTVFSIVDNILNDNQNERTYRYYEYEEDDYLAWQIFMIKSVDRGIPAVLDLKISPRTLPNYESTVAGHILNTSGYDAQGDLRDDPRIRLTDPFDQGNRGRTIGNRWYDMDSIFEANQDHFRGAVIY
ncbi:C39 family peptidase [Aureibacillus halotolerans]|uniref:Peptidase C39-like protein n=1 Tax=Aureibacillus halotolerans TaxID=1508390 RepID=A0A4R6U6E1_9BACI|nr:C39 family peptidase [Aureibacillus halotolerans]TDQ41162.1 peptidase C39-like protein [Aureibacillus halotolerans]